MLTIVGERERSNPCTAKNDGVDLHVRVDSLHERVDSLHERVDRRQTQQRDTLRAFHRVIGSLMNVTSHPDCHSRAFGVPSVNGWFSHV